MSNCNTVTCYYTYLFYLRGSSINCEYLRSSLSSLIHGYILPPSYINIYICYHRSPYCYLGLLYFFSIHSSGSFFCGNFYTVLTYKFILVIVSVANGHYLHFLSNSVTLVISNGVTLFISSRNFFF